MQSALFLVGWINGHETDGAFCRRVGHVALTFRFVSKLVDCERSCVSDVSVCVSDVCWRGKRFELVG